MSAERAAGVAADKPRRGTRILRTWWPELLLLLLYGVLVIALRPPDPFEWDEVQYMSGVEHYNVALHHPHPPGAPALVAAGWVVRIALRDTALSLQVVSILSALASLVLVWRLTLIEGGRRWAALAAAVGLAVMPGFLFYGSVAMTEVPGIAATLATVLLAVRALDEPGRLPAAALAAAVALAIRPHLVLALLPVGVAVIWVAVRRRAWRSLGLAVAVGTAASLLLWLPAILLTGWKAYWITSKLHAAYIADFDGQFALPRADLLEQVKHWLVHPLGKKELAVPFYLLAAAGAVAWWRVRARRLVLLAATSAVVFIVGTAFSLSMMWGVRYGLPMLPFLCVLVAGNVVWGARAARLVMAVAGATLGVMLLGWARQPLLQRLEPSPIWACLQHIRANHDPARTVVLVSGAMRPHAEYVLSRAGFVTDTRQDSPAFVKARQAGKAVVYVGLVPLAGMVTEKELRWDSPRLLQLAFWRYDRCLVQRPEAADGPHFDTAWEVRDDGWLVWGKGTVELPPGARQHHGSVCVKQGYAFVSSWGLGSHLVAPDKCTDVLLDAGPAGRLTVKSHKEWVLLEPMKLKPLLGAPLRQVPPGTSSVEQPAASGTFVLPAAAHAGGTGGARWRTRMLLVNSSFEDARVVLTFLPSGVSSPVARAAAHPLVAGAYLTLEDVVVGQGLSQANRDVVGALLVSLADASGDPLADPAAVRMEAATFDEAAGVGAERAGGGVPLVPVAEGLVAGNVIRLAVGAGAGSARVSLGAVALGDGAAELEVGIEGPGWDMVVGGPFRVPPQGHSQRRVPVLPSTAAVRVRVVAAPGVTRVIPYLAVVDNRTGVAEYVVGRGTGDAGRAALPTLPIVTVVKAGEKR